MSKGFIKISRKLFQNPFWNEAREYSKAEAWIDLIQLARFEASTEIIQGKVIDLEKGEVPASLTYLENRWSWGNTKVRNFLKILKRLGMTTQRTTQGQTVLKLVKYKDYNSKQHKDKQQNNTGTTRGQHSSNINIKNIRTKERKEQKEDGDFDFFEIDHELKKYSKEVGEFFGKTSEDQIMPVFGFLNRLKEKGNLDSFKNQFKAYKEFKNKSGQNIHGWDSFCSEWSKTNWEQQIINLKKIKQQDNSQKTFRTNR